MNTRRRAPREHGPVALEDLVAQAHANARQTLRTVDRPGALRGLLDPGVIHTGERLDQRQRGRFGKRQIVGLTRQLTLRAYKLAACAVPVSQASHALRARQCRDANSLAGDGAQRAGTGKGHGGIAGRNLIAKPDSVAKWADPRDPSLTPAQTNRCAKSLAKVDP